MCGHVLTVTMLWLQVRVGIRPIENLGTFVNFPCPLLRHDQSAIEGCWEEVFMICGSLPA